MNAEHRRISAQDKLQAREDFFEKINKRGWSIVTDVRIGENEFLYFGEIHKDSHLSIVCYGQEMAQSSYDEHWGSEIIQGEYFVYDDKRIEVGSPIEITQGEGREKARELKNDGWDVMQGVVMVIRHVPYPLPHKEGEEKGSAIFVPQLCSADYLLPYRKKVTN